jgi:hypothetical protein
MKRKIFTLFVCAFFVAGVTAQQPSGVIKKVEEAPIIDGVVDDAWADANEYTIELPFQSEVPTVGASGETTWKALWSADGVSVLLKVTDDAFYPHYSVTPAGNSWEYDKPEIYFDVNYVLQDGLGAGGGNGHYQSAPAFVEGSNDGTPFTEGNGVVHAFMVTEPNYIAEYFIPFSWLKDKDGVLIDLTANIGFDVTIIDRDPGDAARKRAVWANAGAISESWNNMDECGIITFEGATAGVDVESITLTGGTITTDNGTLQIVAEVLPENATNKALAWSVENGTGKASISTDGIVTAIANGDVTVTAASTDGSYEEASVVITITGQITTLWELNVIKNGNFDQVNVDGTATLWGGWGGPSNAAMPQIIDGVAVCTPILGANNWEYQFNESGLTALPNVDYIFTFQAWSDADRTFCVDFEDTPSNNYNRYGASSDPSSAGGRSEWTFDINTTERTWWVLHVNFDQMVETTVQKVQYMLALAGDIIYLDSIILVTAEEYTTVGVPVQKVAPKVRVYPNPVVNDLTVVMPAANSKLTIFDSVGRRVHESIEASDRAVINVRDYARGVYFVKVNDEPAVKFIK